MKKISLFAYPTTSSPVAALTGRRWAAVLGLLFFASCSGLKYIPEGQKLYTGSTVKLEAPDKLRNQSALQTELELLVRPQPNASFLGLRPKLYFWHLGVGKTKGIGHFLAGKLGEAPVLLTDAQPANTRGLMVNRLQNRGYFHGAASSETKTTANTAR